MFYTAIHMDMDMVSIIKEVERILIRVKTTNPDMSLIPINLYSYRIQILLQFTVDKYNVVIYSLFNYTFTQY